MKKINKQYKVILTLISFMLFMNLNVKASVIGNGNIHFIHVGNGDCILIESDGEYAIIDGGNDEATIKKREDKIANSYIKSILGNNKLKFAIATHAHDDHIGQLDNILLEFGDENTKLYTKVYNDDIILDAQKFNNKEVFAELIKAMYKLNGISSEGVNFSNIKKVDLLKVNNIVIPREEDLSSRNLEVGKLRISIINYEDTNLEKTDDNSNSLGLVVTDGRLRAFLAGDIDISDGDEIKLVNNNVIGKVDLLKLGHHGLPGSSSDYLISSIRPRIAIVTTSRDYVAPEIKESLEKNNVRLYFTGKDKNELGSIIYQFK